MADVSRQQRVARQIQKDLGELFSREFRELFRGAMVTVMGVRMSPDLEYARVHVSVFPFERHGEIMGALGTNNWAIRKALGGRLRNQLRVVPEMVFVLDDSFEYIEKIEDLLK